MPPQSWMSLRICAWNASGGTLNGAAMGSQTGAFAVVKAPSHEAAARMFENHPHFAIFPGERVEIMPVLPIPGG